MSLYLKIALQTTGSNLRSLNGSSDEVLTVRNIVQYVVLSLRVVPVSSQFLELYDQKEFNGCFLF